MLQLYATNNGFPYPASIYADVMYAVITGALVQRKKMDEIYYFWGSTAVHPAGISFEWKND